MKRPFAAPRLPLRFSLCLLSAALLLGSCSQSDTPHPANAVVVPQSGHSSEAAQAK